MNITCLLFYLTGKVGYQDYSLGHEQLTNEEITELNLSKELIVKMLKRENELRLSTEMQMEYKLSQQNGFKGFVQVTENMQKQVAKEFGFNEDIGIKV